LKGWQAGRAPGGPSPERLENRLGGETRLEDPHSRAGTDVRAARFGKTLAAAASNRPAAADDVPWTHVPAQNGEQSRNALGRWLQRWLGLASGRSASSGDRAGVGPWSPRSPATPQQCETGTLASAGTGSKTSGMLPQIKPRRIGGLARTRAPVRTDDARDELSSDHRPLDRVVATRIGTPRVKQPGPRQIVEAGCPQHRWIRAHRDR
jgi:hypothetical protein